MNFNQLEKTKKWLSFDEQIKYLAQSGLKFYDLDNCRHYLMHINYYRLKGYFYPFQEHNVQRSIFKIGSYFEDIKNLYIFDKKMRLLALDILERIEISVRTQVVQTLGKAGAISYTNRELAQSYFNKNFMVDKYGYDYFLEKINQKIKKEKHKEEFIKHFLAKYGKIPIWAVAELWDFGNTSKCFEGLQDKHKNLIAKKYGFKYGVELESVLHALNDLRNVSAHHRRLWNKKIVIRSKKNFKGNKNFEILKKLNTSKPLFYFCLMQILVKKINPDSSWGERFLSLLDEFPQPKNKCVSLKDIGLEVSLEEFKNWSIWKK